MRFLGGWAGPCERSVSPRATSRGLGPVAPCSPHGAVRAAPGPHGQGAPGDTMPVTHDATVPPRTSDPAGGPLVPGSCPRHREGRVEASAPPALAVPPLRVGPVPSKARGWLPVSQRSLTALCSDLGLHYPPLPQLHRLVTANNLTRDSGYREGQHEPQSRARKRTTREDPRGRRHPPGRPIRPPASAGSQAALSPSPWQTPPVFTCFEVRILQVTKMCFSVFSCWVLAAV